LFEPASRYYEIEEAMVRLPDGRVATYKRRRRIPPPASFQTLAVVKVSQGDRLDVITARLLGDPEQFWRVCDANADLDPFQLTAEIGRALRVPVPRI
jgi:hypothetical protein